MNENVRVRQWVGSGGIQIIFPMLLKVVARVEKTLSPFKFNLLWFEEEEFVNLVQNTWIPSDGGLRNLATL